MKVVEVERELDGRGVSDVGQWSSTIDCLLDLLNDQGWGTFPSCSLALQYSSCLEY